MEKLFATDKKPVSTLNVRIFTVTHKKLKKYAKVHKMSLSRAVEEILKGFLTTK